MSTVLLVIQMLLGFTLLISGLIKLMILLLNYLTINIPPAKGFLRAEITDKKEQACLTGNRKYLPAGERRLTDPLRNLYLAHCSGSCSILTGFLNAGYHRHRRKKAVEHLPGYYHTADGCICGICQLFFVSTLTNYSNYTFKHEIH